jgi:uncharacterized GH25 family protein
MKKLVTALLLTAVFPGMSLAARAWLLPSQTIVARSGGWVSFDAANSDDLFSFNQGALPLDGLAVVTPDGAEVAAQNVASGKTRSSFDLELHAPGTYRVAVASDLVMARWEEDGKPRRWRGTAAEMAANLPPGAKDVEVEQLQRRVEAFVTVGTPTALKPVGVGLELLPAARHPNDLYAGEAASFQLLLDGKPAAHVEVAIIAGGTRYRTSPQPIRLETDKTGTFTVIWPAPGLYWLDAAVRDQHATVPNVTQRTAGYDATLEVLPQ